MATSSVAESAQETAVHIDVDGSAHSSDSHRASTSSDHSKASSGSLDIETISKRYERIVCVGIDNSALCEQAFNWYLDNLHRHGNYIVFVHSIELPQMYSYQEVYAPAEMWEASMKHEASKTKELQEKYAYKLRFHRIPGRFLLRSAKPGEAIVKVAEEYGADMIVVGTRGLGLVRRTILGSVSGYVMHHARVPVVVCRSPKAARHPEHHYVASASVPAAIAHTSSHVHYANTESRAQSYPVLTPSPASKQTHADA